MKVILLQKTPGLGDVDDIKEVADGYARNFLFPRHLAVQASTKALDQREAHHRKQAKEAERDLHESEQLAAKIDGLEIELVEKATEKGVLYAAVTPQKVSMALQKIGFSIEPDQIKMKPMKELGAMEVPVKFGHGLEVQINLTVNPQKEKHTV